jgi:hydrogenase expression/formation protein HypE
VDRRHAFAVGGASEGAAAIRVGAEFRQAANRGGPPLRRSPRERRAAVGVSLDLSAELDQTVDCLDAVRLRRPDERLVENLLRVVGRRPSRESAVWAVEAAAGPAAGVPTSSSCPRTGCALTRTRHVTVSVVPPSDLPVGKLPGQLLARLVATYATSDPTVVVGPGLGGDAAAIDVGATTLVVKSDPITFASESPARYLVDVNANDLACLGATPRWMMVTALLPEGTTEELVESHFRELRDACLQRSISLVGGHTEVTFGIVRPILVGVLIGEVEAGRLLRPGGARPGDRLLLTNAIAVEGTALVARELGDRLRDAVDPLIVERAANFLADPGISVAAEAIVLLDAGGITALHDPTEGGLATGVRELALAAGCAATIDRDAVPILPETAAIADALGLDPLGMLASGSLLAAADPEAVERLMTVSDTLGFGLTPIGEVTEQRSNFVLRANGLEHELPVYESDETTRALGSGTAV